MKWKQPENILLMKDERVKLTNFKASCSKSSSFDSFSCSLPTEYLAPEVLVQSPFGFSADLWSLGVLFYEFLHGVVPFRGKTKAEIYERMVSEAVPFPETTSDFAKDLITRLLQVDPRKRIKAFEVLSHPLIKWHLAQNGFTSQNSFIRSSQNPSIRSTNLNFGRSNGSSQSQNSTMGMGLGSLGPNSMGKPVILQPKIIEKSQRAAGESQGIIIPVEKIEKIEMGSLFKKEKNGFWSFNQRGETTKEAKRDELDSGKNIRGSGKDSKGETQKSKRSDLNLKVDCFSRKLQEIESLRSSENEESSLNTPFLTTRRKENFSLGHGNLSGTGTPTLRNFAEAQMGTERIKTEPDSFKKKTGSFFNGARKRETEENMLPERGRLSNLNRVSRVDPERTDPRMLSLFPKNAGVSSRSGFYLADEAHEAASSMGKL